MADKTGGSGGDLRVQNAPLMSNQQMLLLDQMIRGASGMMQKTVLGAPYQGPDYKSYKPKEFLLGGAQTGVYKPWDLRKVGTPSEQKDDTDPRKKEDPGTKYMLDARGNMVPLTSAPVAAPATSGLAAALSALGGGGGYSNFGSAYGNLSGSYGNLSGSAGGGGTSINYDPYEAYPMTGGPDPAIDPGGYPTNPTAAALRGPMEFNQYAKRDMYTTPFVTPFRNALGRPSRYSMPYGY